MDITQPIAETVSDFLVMIVGDTPAINQFINSTLEEHYRCHQEKYGNNALSNAIKLQPDIILLDATLPDNCGYTVCRQLNENPLTSSIPIIFMAQCDSVYSEHMALMLGATDYITMPIIAPELLALRIRNHLNVTANTRRLQKECYTDALTGIGNRRYFDAELDARIKMAEQQKTSLSIVLLDLDYFKFLNDHLGHQAGDEALRDVAKKLKLISNCYSASVARYGGEEFALIINGLLPSELQEFMRKICSLIEDLQISNPKSPVKNILTASAGGIFLSSNNYPCKERLITSADNMLYRAKESGRNTSKVSIVSV